MKNGIINPSKNAPFGFSPDHFDGWLWKINDAIFISFIECLSPGKGYFRKLIESILSQGFTVKIPTPLGRMQEIVIKNKYKKTYATDKDMGTVEIWEKKP
jgi:hypothetical protein